VFLVAERIEPALLNTLVLPSTSILPPALRKAARSAAIRSLVSMVAALFLRELARERRLAAGWRVCGWVFVLDIASPVCGVPVARRHETHRRRARGVRRRTPQGRGRHGLTGWIRRPGVPAGRRVALAAVLRRASPLL